MAVAVAVMQVRGAVEVEEGAEVAKVGVGTSD
jgi:hypothetical protein